jgi:hypothetical protein
MVQRSHHDAVPVGRDSWLRSCSRRTACLFDKFVLVDEVG